MGERGVRNEPATAQDIARLCELVSEAQAAGAFGLSINRAPAHKSADGEPVPGGFLFGLDAIVISGTLGQVKTQFDLTSGEEGLFVSASLIGCAIGAAIASTSADRLGRKPSLIFAGLITLTGVTICSLADTPALLIASRFIGGLGVGVASLACPLCIAETAPAHLRGRLTGLYQFAITLGSLAALFCNALIAAWIESGAGSDDTLARLFDHEAWRLMQKQRARMESADFVFDPGRRQDLGSRFRR